MRILAFDQGHTTGIACLSTGQVQLAICIPGIWLMNLPTIEQIIDWTSPGKIVIEKLPSQRTDALTSQISHKILECAKVKGIEVAQIPPGIWKPVVKIRGRLPAPYLQHVKDAVGMAWYCENLA